MKEYEITMVKCPECGKYTRIQKYEVVHSRRNRTQKNRILKDSLFDVSCSFCGNEFRYVYDMIYADSKHRYRAVLASSEESSEDVMTALKNEDYSQQIGEILEDYVDDGYRIRVVRDSRTLAEKALIFDRGLDDRIIELAKIILGGVLKKDDPDIEKMYFNEAIYDDGSREKCFIGSVNGELQSKPYGLTDRVLWRISEAYSKYLAIYEKDDYEVDEAWAEDFLGFVGENEDYYDRDLEDFIDDFYNLEGQREQSDLVMEKWDSIFDGLLEHWYESHDEKPSIKDIGYTEEEYLLSELLSEIDIPLLNNKEYEYLKGFYARLLEELDYSKNLLSYHNYRRSYMEMIEYLDGEEKAMEYLDEWYREEPDNLYVIGTYIDRYLWHDEDEKALALAEKYLNHDMRYDYEEWFYDAVENLYNKLNMKKEIKKLNVIRKRQRAKRKSTYL